MISYICANKISANPEYQQVNQILACGLKEFLSVSDQNAKLYLEHSHPEALHQYRVALRQARSLLKASRKVLEPSLATDLNLVLKKLLEPTGELRDTEVFLQQLNQYSFELNGYLSLGKQLMTEDMKWEMVKLRNNIRSWFVSGDYLQQSDLAFRLIDRIEEIPVQEPPKLLIDKFINRQKKWLDNRLDKLSELPIEELHRFRIKVKVLRYTSSFYQPGQDKTRVKKVKKVQDHLGLIHDYSVQKTLILRYIEQKQANDKNLKYIALFAGYLLRYLTERHDYHLEQVREHMAGI
ncbi:CHAD domain-containing protein [Vibrio sp. JC009]|uniref:CHAD domain-containing protein n=1 Tax=Vibrio sp. JC009 TaxID=2912314 RepID=UPI0023AEC280|nr:CHAD domain-containing protein [Vibrio sp. JC009]WED23119.1 CHAD domain-containing protein [Vibrio sp. JC009]